MEKILIKKRPEKRATGVYLEEQTYSKVVDIAKKNGISVSSAMSQLIEFGVELVERESNHEQCA